MSEEAEMSDEVVEGEVQWGCMPAHEGWLYDTTVRGNGNGGHDFGTDLPDEMKQRLLEYLKTL
jgi:hypothetical protein